MSTVIPHIRFTLKFENGNLVVLTREYSDANISEQEFKVLPAFVEHMKNAAIRFIKEHHEH